MTSKDAEEKGGGEDETTPEVDSEREQAVSDDEPQGAAEESDEAADLEIKLPTGSIVAERNVNIGNTYFIHGDRRGEKRDLISVADVSDQVAEMEAAFVEPETFSELVATIDRKQVIILTGRHCGNRTAAGAALRECEHHPILELPASLAPDELVNGIEQLCKVHRHAGLLIHSLDEDQLGKLAGFELRRLRTALGDTAAVAIAVRGDGGASRARDLPVVAGIPPKPDAVLAKRAEVEGLTTEARERADGALAMLPQPISPGSVVELVALAAGSGATNTEMAAILQGRSSALDEWLQARPTARSVASLAAAATLDGVPSGDFEGAADELAEALAEPVEASAEEKRFGPRANRDLPADLVDFSRATVPTHFGLQDVEVVRIAPPLGRDLVITFLWNQLDAGFRQPYLEWLRRLASQPSRRLIRAAGLTAGSLFIADPLRIERELLSPWAREGGYRARQSTTFALGGFVTKGADPFPARALAQSWLQASTPSLRRAAIFAYGGPLGVWDEGADAAARLWRIAAEAPELQPAADRALASLVAGGRDATRARAAVMGLLLAKLDLKPAPRRVYEVLVLLVRRLTARDQGARNSLAALAGPAEREVFDKFATLLALTLDAPPGRKSALESLRTVLAAISAGHVGREFLDELLIPQMRIVAGERSRLSQLEAQLERLLKVESRGRGPSSEVARSTYDAMHATR